MKSLVAALLVLSVAHAHAADLTGFKFSDPAVTEAVGKDDYGRLIVYYCAHCPTARKMMLTEVKALGQAIQKHHAPLRLICVTPDKRPKEASAYGASIGLPNAAFGFDAANKKNISLNNIYQMEFLPAKGKKGLRTSLPDLTALAELNDPSGEESAFGSYRFKPPKMADAKLKELWWAIENGNADAFAALAKGKKKAKPGKKNGDDVIALATAISDTLQAEMDAAMAGGDDFITYEALEDLLAVSEGYIEISDAEARLKSLDKDKAIKDELKAREAYLKCSELLLLERDKETAKAKDGFRQISEKFPDTVYGQKAKKAK